MSAAKTRRQRREQLWARGLRATGPRLAVMRILSGAQEPLSCRQVYERLGETDWERTTIYRNLVKLREAGLARIVSRVEGTDRYALVSADAHPHAHFVCEDCGRLACLPRELSASVRIDGPWSVSVRAATLQLRGTCPDCLPASISAAT